MPLEPFGDFLAAVAHLAERDAGADGRAAREYLDAFSKRRQIVAQIERQVRAARQPRAGDQGRRRRAGLHRDRARREPRHQPARSARVDRPHHRLDRPRGSAGRSSTTCRVRRLDAVAAPRVLDEGIDVPDANLGIVMSASRTRRQMIQRMGRILRRKRAGVARPLRDHVRQGHAGGSRQPHRARRLPRRDRAHLRGDGRVRRRAASTQLDAFLAAPGPAVVPEPEHLDRYEPAASRPRASTDGARLEMRWSQSLTDGLGLELAYTLAHVHAHDPDAGPRPTSIRAARRPAPASRSDTPRTSRLSSPSCRTIGKPKVEPKRLSTGQQALEIARIGRRGASAAPDAAKHHRSWSSGGRCSTRPWPAAARDVTSFRSRMSSSGKARVEERLIFSAAVRS